jgi:hypothetical protein
MNRFTKLIERKLFAQDQQSIAPAMAFKILYGAREMSKKSFYIDAAQKYLNYLEKFLFIEKILFYQTSKVKFSVNTILVSTSRRTLRNLQLYRHFKICFVSITLLNLPFLLKKRIRFVSFSIIKGFLDQLFLKQLDVTAPYIPDSFGVEEYLSTNNFQSFIYDTPSTLNNLIAYYFKQQNKPVIYLQHGIYQLNNYKVDDTTKTLASSYVVWGEQFKELFIKNGIDEKQVRVACINKPVYKAPKARMENTVCFLGLPLMKFNSHVKEEILNIICKTYYACLKNNLSFVYKPHPMEEVAHTKLLLAERLVKPTFLPVGESFEKSLTCYEYFVGLYSTSLIEATLHGRRSLQVMMSSKSYDDFERLGICPSVYLKQSDLAQVLKDLVTSETGFKSTLSDYVKSCSNPGEEYKKAIQSFLSHEYFNVSSIPGTRFEQKLQYDI